MGGEGTPGFRGVLEEADDGFDSSGGFSESDLEESNLGRSISLGGGDCGEAGLRGGGGEAEGGFD